MLFDLDGTIIHSAPVIVEALAHMYESLGFEVPSEAELMSWIGPPLRDSMRDKLALNPAESSRAIEIYRGYHRNDATNVAVFPGVVGVLEQLAAANIPVALATSKRERTAQQILEKLQLGGLFSVIVGANDDDSGGLKQDVVAEALLRLEYEGFDIGNPVMVGDRAHDVLGAAANGVPTILVEWGYGNPSEARDALAVVHSADQLRTLLLG